MRDGDDWEALAPDAVVEVVTECDGVARIQAITDLDSSDGSPAP